MKVLFKKRPQLIIGNVSEIVNMPGESENRLAGYQVIPGHGNPQKRWTMVRSYLFKYCCVKHQTFHQVCEKASQ